MVTDDLTGRTTQAPERRAKTRPIRRVAPMSHRRPAITGEAIKTR